MSAKVESCPLMLRQFFNKVQESKQALNNQSSCVTALPWPDNFPFLKTLQQSAENSNNRRKYYDRSADERPWCSQISWLFFRSFSSQNRKFLAEILDLVRVSYVSTERRNRSPPPRKKDSIPFRPTCAPVAGKKTNRLFLRIFLFNFPAAEVLCFVFSPYHILFLLQKISRNNTTTYLLARTPT